MHATTRWHLENMPVKEVRHKRSQVVGFHSCEKSRTGQLGVRKQVSGYRRLGTLQGTEGD